MYIYRGSSSDGHNRARGSNSASMFFGDSASFTCDPVTRNPKPYAINPEPWILNREP